MVVPVVPAQGFGSAASPIFKGTIFPSLYLVLYAHGDFSVFVVITTCETCVILANASPRNPNVRMLFKSSNRAIFDVVNRSHKMGKSSFRMPWPLSESCKFSDLSEYQ
jgi:hypothetical protein